MNDDTVRYEVLKAQYSTDQGLYNGVLQLLSAGGIDAGLKAQNINRMSAADIPTTPSWPQVFVYTFAGFSIGMTLAIVIITVIIIVSDTAETVEQIEEALRLPVLTSVPLYKMEPADPASTQAVLATLLMPRSAAAESYRILRTAINLMPIRGRGRVIGVTSCGPGEGKSTTVMNLAVACSQQNKRVLLIDGDLRKPALAQRLKLPSATTPGLSRYLSDPQIQPEDCIQPIQSLPGLSVLPVQDIPPFPSELSLKADSAICLHGQEKTLMSYSSTRRPSCLLPTRSSSLSGSTSCSSLPASESRNAVHCAEFAKSSRASLTSILESSSTLCLNHSPTTADTADTTDTTAPVQVTKQVN